MKNSMLESGQNRANRMFTYGEIDPFDDKEGRKNKEYMESNAFRDDTDEYGQLGLQLSTMIRKSTK